MIMHYCEVESTRGTYWSAEAFEVFLPKRGAGKGSTREEAGRRAKADLVARNLDAEGMASLADTVREIV